MATTDEADTDEVCSECEGSGIIPSGVEHMGAHEYLGCWVCQGTGVEP